MPSHPIHLSRQDVPHRCFLKAVDYSKASNAVDLSRQEWFMQTRSETLRLPDSATYDVCVIGGGASGAGCALDAQLRGLRTLLLEGADFASRTSSASTK